MKNLSRHAFSVLLAALIALSALSLVGCGGGADDQDNCYGDDLPAVKG